MNSACVMLPSPFLSRILKISVISLNESRRALASAGLPGAGDRCGVFLRLGVAE